jgi:hypothetical protein
VGDVLSIVTAKAFAAKLAKAGNPTRAPPIDRAYFWKGEPRLG